MQDWFGGFSINTALKDRGRGVRLNLVIIYPYWVPAALAGAPML